MTAPDPTPVRAGEDAGREATGLPSEADYLRETIKVVEWQRDNARQERNEERARASAAEAEVARLRGELEEAQVETEVIREGSEQSTQMLDRIAKALGLAHDEGLETSDPYLAVVSALRERVARLEEALRPFAEITPSTLHHNDGSEREPYSVVMSHPDDAVDFTGADLARARAALTEGAPTDV